jgi:endo-1,4-beta-xylanase
MTEVDIAGAPAADYVAITKACYDTPNCAGITVWGVVDSQSWRASQKGLLFDDGGREKAAFTAIANALKP